MHFPQLIGTVFLPLFPSRYHYPIFTESAQQGYVVLYHTELTVHFIYFCSDLCPIPRFLGFGLSRRYAAVSAADSTVVPNVGRSKSTSNTFVGVVLIALVIIVHAALCRRSSSDLAKAVSNMYPHAIAAYVILWIITHL